MQNYPACIGLKTLLQQGISEPELYSDFVYKFKRNVGHIGHHLY